jgi:hypothetical protein
LYSLYCPIKIDIIASSVNNQENKWEKFATRVFDTTQTIDVNLDKGMTTNKDETYGKFTASVIDGRHNDKFAVAVVDGGCTSFVADAIAKF